MRHLVLLLALPAQAEQPEVLNPQYFPVTGQIHALVAKKGDSPAVAAEMKAYTEKVPRANDGTFDLVPVPGGEFTIGSPSTEAGRKDNDEGARREGDAPAMEHRPGTAGVSCAG
ncbi:hypothetical protein OKA05_14510 [Luteolibacter arcticus]|uniref:Uncharacterized protein n=1 Tax=Luteolibacter arcticus TaxID=1581411 RepID=A0ABT3GJV5_9BACT|nr:hypothetical protein [Luteolibacter arcticus]MCW1923776.1 hypothetical protein [Luteolibacter arcticus]